MKGTNPTKEEKGFVEIIGEALPDRNNGSSRVIYRCECGSIGETRLSRALKQKWCNKCNRLKSRLSENKFKIEGDFAFIDVSTRKFPNAFCRIDLKNLEKVLDGKGRWFAANFNKSVVYAVRNSINEKMHRLIINPKEGEEIDHFDGDGLNNTESNLSAVSHADNMKNRSLGTKNKSGVIGVCWHKTNKKWHAQGGLNGEKISIGFFDNLNDAALARKNFEIINFFNPNHGRKMK